jgi:hypothetical protein
MLYRRTGQDGVLDTFRYTPFIAATLAPWSLLPERLGGILWRLVNSGVYVGGAWWLLRAAAPVELSRRQTSIFFLLLVPLALTSLGNGQVNPLIIGLLLAGLAAARVQRWWLSAVFIALATSLKLYPLAIGLLLVVCYPRRFLLPLVTTLLAVAALPFVLQRPVYVLAEYREWLSLLEADDRKNWPLHMMYRDLWLLFRVWDVPIAPRTYQSLQVLGGVSCAIVCVLGRRRGQPARRVALSVLSLGCCWMVLLGPASESATYILLAPSLAWALVAEPSTIARGCSFVGAGFLLLCVLAGLSRESTAVIHGYGFHPLGALFVMAGAFVAALKGSNAPIDEEDHREKSVPPLAA